MKIINGYSRLLLFVIPLLLFTPNIHAAVIYDNGVTAFDSYIVSQSIAGQVDQIVADDFSLNTPATITGIKWKGTYSTFSPQQDNFYIQISADDNGMPQTNALYTLPFGNNVNRTEWIVTPGASNATYIFNYSVDFSAIDLPAGNYWLSIFTNPPSDNPFYRWCWVHQFAPGQGTEAIRYALDQPYAYTLSGYRTDYQLFGISSVPVPAAFWLFGSGLTGLIGFMQTRTQKMKPGGGYEKQ